MLPALPLPQKAKTLISKGILKIGREPFSLVEIKHQKVLTSKRFSKFQQEFEVICLSSGIGI